MQVGLSVLTTYIILIKRCLIGVGPRFDREVKMQIDYTTPNQIKTADVRTLSSRFAPGQHVSGEDIKPSSPYPAIVTYSPQHNITIPGLSRADTLLRSPQTGT